MQVTVFQAHLRAAQPLQAKQDIRYYLNGVLIEATEDRVRVVATDGSLLGVLRNPRPEGEREAVSIIVPSAALDDILKKAPKSLQSLTFVQKEGGYWTVAELEGLGTPVLFKPIEGRFPEWRRVLPTSTTGEPSQYDPDLLVRFKKTAKALGDKKGIVHVHQNGPGAGLVHVPGQADFVGVVMPYRTYGKDATPPTSEALAANFA